MICPYISLRSGSLESERDYWKREADRLKEKLIQERGKYIAVYEEDEWDFDDLPELDAREYIRTARQQLKADPDLQKAGVAWDE